MDDIEFLFSVLLTDLSTGKRAHIIKVEGAESGHDHLRVYTQSLGQRESGVATRFRIYPEEVKILQPTGGNSALDDSPFETGIRRGAAILRDCGIDPEKLPGKYME